MAVRVCVQVSWCVCGRTGGTDSWPSRAVVRLHLPGCSPSCLTSWVGGGPGGGPQAGVGSYPWVAQPADPAPPHPTGTRESAFVYALSAAAISHAIARACTTGDLPGCSCGPVPGEPPGPGNRWGGCADNLSYGLLMGAKFSDAPMKVKKTGSQANKLMRLHNSEVGRQVTTPPRWLCLCPLAEKGHLACPGGGGGGGTGPDPPTPMRSRLPQLFPVQLLGACLAVLLQGVHRDMGCRTLTEQKED